MAFLASLVPALMVRINPQLTMLNGIKRLWRIPLYVLGAAILAGVLYAVICTIIIVQTWPNMPKDPDEARAFIERIDLDIELPDFDVIKHTFDFIGGDDTDERWEVVFKEPLSEEFVSKLDSCLVNNDRWELLNENTYKFHYRDSIMVEWIETVIIDLSTNTAELTHLNI